VIRVIAANEIDPGSGALEGAVSDLLARAQNAMPLALERALERIQARRCSDGSKRGHLTPLRLIEAMRYSLLSPGKRLRPALVFGAAEAIGGRIDDVFAGACAVEMVHTYSLIHDDLPSMDDSDTRRGRPACHRTFDEVTALLAGDALLTEAFSILADERPLMDGAKPVRARRRIKAVLELARSAGCAGMVGGQQDDIAGSLDREGLESIHRRKTGRLIQASAALGAILGGGTQSEVRLLRGFGADVGLAFQLVDDAIDGDGTARIDGTEKVLEDARRLTEHGAKRLAGMKKRAQPLIELARAIVERRS
jgi:geranylgeranyl diphosphate synthase type II